MVHDVLASGRIRQRLLEMGFVRGARLRVAKLAPLGDPMELEIIYRYVSRIPEGGYREGDTTCPCADRRATASG